MNYRDLYKNRAEAFAEFVEGQGLAVSRAKFYDDCLRLHMVQADKTVRLSDLLAWVKNDLKLDVLTGSRREESPGELDRLRQLSEFELRKAKAEVEKLEKANRKEDERWMEVAEHEIQVGALLGLALEEQRQLKDLRLPELLHVAAQGPAELSEALDALLEDGFAEAVRYRERTVAFAEGTEPAGEEAPGA